MKKIVIMLVIAAVACAGCEHNENKPSAKTLPAGTPGAESHIRIGLIPEQNIFRQVERFKPLADYLSRVIGSKIDIIMLTRYGNVVEDFTSEKLDGAFFGSLTYVLAHAKLGVEVLARPESTDGTSTYYGLIFVRKDSRIRTAQDMRGKIFVFVDKATTAGYLLPLAYFRQHGIRNYKTFFRETYFAGTHEDAINDVLNRRADAGAAKNTEYERMALNDGRIGLELSVLQTSPRVPENALAVRPGLNPEVKARLKETLLNLQNTPEGRTILRALGSRRFIETKDDDYLPVREIAKTADLDPATYNYTSNQ
jgi:phosphonate transport system substrate-binding protein